MRCVHSMYSVYCVSFEENLLNHEVLLGNLLIEHLKKHSSTSLPILVNYCMYKKNIKNYCIQNNLFVVLWGYGKALVGVELDLEVLTNKTIFLTANNF